MSNLEEAKESLAKASQMESIMTPPAKTKRIKLPLARDINMIESLINTKLKNKEETYRETALNNAKAKWAIDVKMFHSMAVDLRERITAFAAIIEKETKGSITIGLGTYSGYWGKLPETMIEAYDEDEMLETKDTNIPGLVAIRQEIDEQLLDIKLGLKPISDVKALLEKIDKI